jgi:hypothetical protein
MVQHLIQGVTSRNAVEYTRFLMPDDQKAKPSPILLNTFTYIKMLDSLNIDGNVF